MNSSKQVTRIIYDGDCPFCSAYVRMQRLKDTVGPVELVDARQDSALVQELREAGVPLDEGMVLDFNGQYFHGEDCVTKIALLSTSSGILNKINDAVFKRPWLAGIIYPVLKAGRNFYLKLAGIERLDPR